MNRLGIFQMYDPDGIVEDYITFLLDDITKSFDDFIVVVCGSLKDKEKEKIYRYTSKIYERENYGFDAYAFKDTFMNYISEDELKKYDELVLFNDTFYGPFFSFSEVFKEMEGSKADYWGLTKHEKNYEFRDHVQSYFIVIKSQMLHSKAFMAFWNELDIGEVCFKNLVHNYEVHFTDYFTQNGFSYDAFVKDDEINTTGNNNYNHYASSPYTLIKRYNMPVIKKKVFTESKNLFFTAGEEIQLAYQYIKNNCNYNTDYIWKDLLRKKDMYDLKMNLNLNYIFSIKDENENENVEIPKTVVIAHITYEELFDECIEYLKKVPSDIDICVTSYKDEILEKVDRLSESGMFNMFSKKIPNRGRDVSCIFVGCKELVKKYEYICFVHDKRTTGIGGMYAVGASFHSLVWENMLKSTGYIKQVIKAFNEEKRLGLLCPPKPLHQDYGPVFIYEWGMEDNYQGCIEFAKKLNLKVLPQREKPTFGLSTCFWCKRDALEPLWNADIKYEDFPEEPCPKDGALNHIIERMLVIVAQNRGYYSGIVENNEYASLDLQNREMWMKSGMDATHDRYIKLAYFIGQYNELYIYGAGIEARKVKNVFEKINIEVKGYIVSDEHFEECKSKLKPIVRLRDVPINDDVGIVVGMNYGNTDEIKPLLKSRGYKNIFYFNKKEEQE